MLRDTHLKGAPPAAVAHRYAMTKRVLDVAICLAVMPLALLLMAVIALAILIDSGWPIFFFQ